MRLYASKFWIIFAFFFSASLVHADDTSEEECERMTPNGQLLWGDLHVHTSYSLDANVYGTLATPEDAYRFAKGGPITRSDGSTVRLERPLDFVAVTEHAEWLDFTALCDGDSSEDFADCKNLLENRSPENGPSLFGQYVVKTITGAQPEQLDLCSEDPELCEANSLSRWESIQEQAEAANEPCKFTTLHGYEWSHTPNFRHAHRNIIFKSDAVTKNPIDYIKFPTVEALWDALDDRCRVQDGCEALAIPHNTNMGDGISFDTVDVDAKSLEQRGRYERLIEITQEKGTGECLDMSANDNSQDCNFELYLTRQSRPMKKEDYSDTEWLQMRSSYARALVGRGLAFPGDSAPLRLGFIGSTDTHAGTPGYTDEHAWSGSVLAGAGFDGAMMRKHWSPGGLVGVWATQNTRAAIFEALHRREVYATSGPRIGLRFGKNEKGAQMCGSSSWSPDTTMGGTGKFGRKPEFTIQVQSDTAPIASIEMIKILRRGGETVEKVIPVWTADNQDLMTHCVTFTDENFDPSYATLWYPRVSQQATPRWTSVQCQKVDRCDEISEWDISIQERAWGSPIWHLPER